MQISPRLYRKKRFCATATIESGRWGGFKRLSLLFFPTFPYFFSTQHFFYRVENSFSKMGMYIAYVLCVKNMEGILLKILSRKRIEKLSKPDHFFVNILSFYINKLND